MSKFGYDRSFIAYFQPYARNTFKNWTKQYVQPYMENVLGYTQYKNTQASLKAQREYDSYLKATNQRALNDWYTNVGRPQGRFIKYPGLSYPGQIYRADTSIARAGFDYDTAYANYTGNLPYRFAGLYGIGSRVSRYI